MTEESSQRVEAFLVDKRAAANLLGVSLRMIDNLIQRGELTTRRIGRRVLLHHKELRAFAEKEN
jgi:excisionase family DNA binding protein